MQSEWFEEFARKLVEIKGINAPSKEVEDQLVKDISERARDAVLQELMSDLTDEELKTLDKATDEGDQKTADEIFSKHQEVVTLTLHHFKNIYLGKA